MRTPVNYDLWTGEQCPTNASHLPNADTLHASVLEKHIVVIKTLMSRQSLPINTSNFVVYFKNRREYDRLHSGIALRGVFHRE